MKEECSPKKVQLVVDKSVDQIEARATIENSIMERITALLQSESVFLQRFPLDIFP